MTNRLITNNIETDDKAILFLFRYRKFPEEMKLVQSSTV